MVVGRVGGEKIAGMGGEVGDCRREEKRWLWRWEGGGGMVVWRWEGGGR